MSLIGLCFGTGTTSASFQEGGRRDSWNEELRIAETGPAKRSAYVCKLSDGHSTRWLFMSTVPTSSWNLKRWCLRREENRRIRSKTLGVRTGTNNKLNSHVTTGLGVEPRLLGWEVSALTLRLPCSLFAQGFLIDTG